MWGEPKNNPLVVLWTALACLNILIIFITWIDSFSLLGLITKLKAKGLKVGPLNSRLKLLLNIAPDVLDTNSFGLMLRASDVNILETAPTVCSLPRVCRAIAPKFCPAAPTPPSNPLSAEVAPATCKGFNVPFPKSTAFWSDTPSGIGRVADPLIISSVSRESDKSNTVSLSVMSMGLKSITDILTLSWVFDSIVIG